MNDVNKVFVTGRLTFDPELFRFPSGDAVTTLRLASNRSWKSKDSDEWKEETLFVDVKVYGPPAERAVQNLAKGSFVHVEAELKQENWDDKTSGEKRSKLVLKAVKVTNLSNNKGGNDEEGAQEAGDDTPPTQSPKNAKITKKGPKAPKKTDEDDGDIPF